ncbi:MAG: hypothetical protein H7A35_09705 [Planctomycetales bacterium]|nr:hypothetical protein [bacterium]UNM07152.1 MAG: hypothetical protein H7A35_09705 [Planctomycetales bacterium]
MYIYSETQLMQGILAQLARGNMLMEEVLRQQEQLEQRMQALEESTEEQLRRQAVEIRSRIDDMLLRV